MAKFNFCITTGAPGYLPDDRNYVAADNSVDAFDAIKDALRDFRLFSDEVDEFEECDWKPFFERGCRFTDASTWHFTLATDGGTVLDLIGMTQAEFDTQSADE